MRSIDDSHSQMTGKVFESQSIFDELMKKSERRNEWEWTVANRLVKVDIAK